MSFQLLAPQVPSGAPQHFRLIFATAGRLDELDESAMYAMDYAKMKEGGIAAACPDFVTAKAAGKHTANLGRMPLMVVDGVAIGQITVIKRLVAKRMGLYSDTCRLGRLQNYFGCWCGTRRTSRWFISNI